MPGVRGAAVSVVHLVGVVAVGDGDVPATLGVLVRVPVVDVVALRFAFVDVVAVDPVQVAVAGVVGVVAVQDRDVPAVLAVVVVVPGVFLVRGHVAALLSLSPLRAGATARPPATVAAAGAR
ncbi:hypothetical protein GCM10009783_02320 [Glycomyces lechevalierae]